MNYLLPFLSVILGYALALLLKPGNKKNLKLLLAFSGSFLLALTIIHLLPEIYRNPNPVSGFFIMLGILLQIILEFFSKGAEHGHVHGHQTMSGIPWLLYISLCLHAFLEGLPVGKHHHLAWGISIHHLPIAMILTTFFLKSQLPKSAILFFMFSFAMMTPLGTLISEQAVFAHQYYNQITAIVIGILFHISSTIIFESSEGHKFNVAKVTMIVLGMVLAYLL